MPLRVLHVLDHSIPLHSGYSFRTRAIIEGQRALGWETFHITGAKHYVDAPPEEEVDGLHFFRSPRLNGTVARVPVLNQWAVVSGLTRCLETVVERVRPHLIHAHSPALNGMAALQVARRHSLPIVYEVRAFWEDAAVDHGTTREGSMRYRLSRGLENYVLRNADAVTCICEGLRGEIVARGIPAARTTVIPNAVNAEQFTYGLSRDEELASAIGLNGESVIGFVGSFYAYEGLELLIRAMAELNSVNTDVRLLLVGGGPQEQHLRSLAVALDVRDRVIFAGRVPHQDIARYYSLIDVLAYPRLSMRLTELVTPLKPLEAMALGKVFVASDVGGHRELIRDGETGVLFRAGEVGELAKALDELLGHKERWPVLREGGRHYVENERTWPHSVERYRQVYGNLVRSSRSEEDLREHAPRI